MFSKLFILDFSQWNIVTFSSLVFLLSFGWANTLSLYIYFFQFFYFFISKFWERIFCTYFTGWCSYFLQRDPGESKYVERYHIFTDKSYIFIKEYTLLSQEIFIAVCQDWACTSGNHGGMTPTNIQDVKTYNHQGLWNKLQIWKIKASSIT